MNNLFTNYLQKNKQETLKYDLIKGLYTDDEPVFNIFVSEFNMDLLQKAIAYTVWKESNGKYTIGRQSDPELIVVMRSTYLQEAKHLQEDPAGQVRELNRKVIKFCVQRILNEIEMHNLYVSEIDIVPYMKENPVSTSLAGSKTLEFKYI